MNPKITVDNITDEQVAREEMERAEQDIQKFEENMESAHEDYDEAREAYDEVNSELEDLQDELDELHEELEDANHDDIANIQSQIDEKRREIDAKSNECNNAKEEIERKHQIWEATKKNYHEAKQTYGEAKKRYKEASRSKSKEEYTRINFTLPKGMKEDWQKFADELKVNTSEMIRTAMEGLTQGMKTGNFSSLTEWEKSMENLGRKIEETVSNNMKNMKVTSDYENVVTTKSPNIPPQQAKSENIPPTEPHKRSRMEVMNELLKLKELLDVGVLNQQEYEELRNKLMKEL